MGELKHILRTTELEIKMPQRYWRGGVQTKKVNYEKMNQGRLDKCAVGV